MRMLVFLALLPVFVFAQEVPPEVKVPTYLDAILAWISSAQNIAVIAIVVEVALRFVKTEKAKSLLIPVKYAFDGLALILAWVSKNVLEPAIVIANKTK